MKKKTKTYLLLAVVLLIWGFLSAKIFGTLNPDGPNQELVMETTTYIPKPISKRDTFSIAANYRDPFLGTLPQTKTPKKTKKKAIQKPQLPKKNIVYSGSIAENGSTKRLFFVTVDGQQHIMAKSDGAAGVKLISGNSTSIKVKYNGYTETIALNQ